MANQTKNMFKYQIFSLDFYVLSYFMSTLNVNGQEIMNQMQPKFIVYSK